MDQLVRSGIGIFGKDQFLSSLEEIRRFTFQEHTIWGAFHKTGLVPLRPEVVLSQIPSGLEEYHRHRNYNRLCTPETQILIKPPSSSSDFDTPRDYLYY